MRKLGINVDAPSSSKGKEKNQGNNGRNPTSRRNEIMSRMLEAMVIIKVSQDRKTSEVHQGNLHPLGTKFYFLVIVMLVQTLDTWQKIVGNITKIDIMVPDNLREAILEEEIMNSYS